MAQISAAAGAGGFHMRRVCPQHPPLDCSVLRFFVVSHGDPSELRPRATSVGNMQSAFGMIPNVAGATFVVK
jgi:hypothetical protein